MKTLCDNWYLNSNVYFLCSSGRFCSVFISMILAEGNVITWSCYLSSEGNINTPVDGVITHGSGHSKRGLEIYNLGIQGHLPERAGAVSWELHPDSSGFWPWALLLRNRELGHDGGGVGEDQSYHRGECICFLCLVYSWLFFQSCSFLVVFS